MKQVNRITVAYHQHRDISFELETLWKSIGVEIIVSQKLQYQLTCDEGYFTFDNVEELQSKLTSAVEKDLQPYLDLLQLRRNNETK